MKKSYYVQHLLLLRIRSQDVVSSCRKDDEMKIAEVQVSGCRCETVRLEPVPRGIVGAVVSIAYTDPAWDSLRKTVVFRGAVTKDVLNAGNEEMCIRDRWQACLTAPRRRFAGWTMPRRS